MQEYSINRSFKGSMVLITGVTGFVGGSLLQRILELEPERVYVLVRKRRGLEPRARIDSVLATPLFSGLELRALEKVYVISGDLANDGLSLSDHNRDLLLSTCTHVFHAAASISFADQLKQAARINLLGTRNLLRLTKKMTKLESMVHVSTAYANCTIDSDERIEEIIYPTSIDPRIFADMVETVSNEELDRRTSKLLLNHPNTYTFTKQMAENLLEAERENVPLSIVRPSIVLSSLKRPISGWIDSVNNSACGFLAGLGKGIFRTIHADPQLRFDAIPVDIVVSTILAASVWAKMNPTKVHIFHATSADTNPLCWSQYVTDGVKFCIKHPCDDCIWYPYAQIRKSWIRNFIVTYVFQVLPAFILNIFWQFIHPGERHDLLGYELRYAKACSYTAYFSTHQWIFSRRNAFALSSALTPSEKNDHPMDPNEINWERYLEICVLGIRQHFHKNSATTTDRAIWQHKWLKIMDNAKRFLGFFLYWYLLTLLLPEYFSTSAAALLAGLFLLFWMWI